MYIAKVFLSFSTSEACRRTSIGDIETCFLQADFLYKHLPRVTKILKVNKIYSHNCICK